MPSLRLPAAAAASLILTFVLTACVKEEPTVLDGSVSASADANEGAPIVVRYYELKGTDAFDSAAFFDVFEQPEATLGTDLLGSGEVALVPGQNQPLNMKLNAETRFVGFAAAYRDIDNADWRGKLPVKPKSVNAVVVEVGKDAMFVNPG